MRRIPLAMTVIVIILCIMTAAQLFMYNTFNTLSEQIILIEEGNGDASELAEQLKTTYAERHRWLLMVADNNLILQLRMVIDTLDPNAQPEEIAAHVKHIKAELMRVESLLLSLL